MLAVSLTPVSHTLGFFAHPTLLRSAPATSLAVLTQPKKVVTLCTVARWISGEPAGIVASSIITG